MVRYMVSFRPTQGMCGDQAFDSIESAREFIKSNKENWISHSLFSYTETGGLVNVLTELEQKYHGAYACTPSSSTPTAE